MYYRILYLAHLSVKLELMAGFLCNSGVGSSTVDGCAVVITDFGHRVFTIHKGQRRQGVVFGAAAFVAEDYFEIYE